MTNAQRSTPAQDEGIAGYVSPYPYLDKLQPRMDERLSGQVPRGGTYCGFCYGRLRKEDTVCGFCGADLAKTGTVSEVPQEVLRAFLAKKKTEERWVHMGAFFGLLVAMALFLWLVVWAPGFLGHPAFGFGVLILGGYALAQLFGPLLAAQVGYRKGARKRDSMWAEFLRRRDGGHPSP